MSIWVHGVTGRMGQAVVKVLERTEGVELGGVIETRTGAASIEWARTHGVPVSTGAPDAPGAVVVDFSQQEAIAPLIAALRGAGVPLVSGTTGLGPGERDLLDVYSKESPVFYAENMSYGICLLDKILRAAGPFLTPFSDVEIVEFHHRHKRDYPSGTALALTDAIGRGAAAAGRSPSSETTGNHVTVHSVRAGGIPGTHEVHFATEDEVLTFTHRALSREVFASGAIRAAGFLTGRRNGMFGMKNLLEHAHA